MILFHNCWRIYQFCSGTCY